MSTGLSLYIEWKEHHQYKSDREALEHLGLSRTTANNWRSGISQPEAAVVIQMAESLGKDPTAYVLRVEAERKSHSEKNRQALMKLARKFAAFLPLLILGLAYSTSSHCEEVHKYNYLQFDITQTGYTFTLIGSGKGGWHECRRSLNRVIGSLTLSCAVTLSFHAGPVHR